MPTERRCAAGDNGSPDLGTAARQEPGGEIGRTEGAQHLGQASPSHGNRQRGVSRSSGEVVPVKRDCARWK